MVCGKEGMGSVAHGDQVGEDHWTGGWMGVWQDWQRESGAMWAMAALCLGAAIRRV